MNPTALPTTSSAARQRGMTLVEIMVAITIGLILMAGVIQIFLANKTTYNTQNAVGRMQENARFALDVMAQTLGMAGYTTAAVPINALTLANTQDNVTANADLGFTTASGMASDTIEVNYEAATDCLGNATGGTASARFFLDGSNLMCLGNGSATAGLLVEGVDNMQILYGVDANNDNIADRYVSAASLIATSRVVSIRVAILVRSIESAGSGDGAVHALLNAPPIGPLNDRQLRRVFNQTILVRNL